MRNWIKLIIESAGQWPHEITGYDLANLIMRNDIHHSPEDFEEGDLYENINAFGVYNLTTLSLDGLKPDLYTIHDDLVSDYAARTSSPAPPIIYDPTHNLVIDGNHRVKAALARGETDILAYVGNPATYSPPEDDDDGEWHPRED